VASTIDHITVSALGELVVTVRLNGVLFWKIRIPSVVVVSTLINPLAVPPADLVGAPQLIADVVPGTTGVVGFAGEVADAAVELPIAAPVVPAGAVALEPVVLGDVEPGAAVVADPVVLGVLGVLVVPVVLGSPVAPAALAPLAALAALTLLVPLELPPPPPQADSEVIAALTINAINSLFIIIS